MSFGRCSFNPKFIVIDLEIERTHYSLRREHTNNIMEAMRNNHERRNIGELIVGLNFNTSNSNGGGANGRNGGEEVQKPQRQIDPYSFEYYARLTWDRTYSSIRYPSINVANFEIKQTIINIISNSVSFYGLSSKELNIYLHSLLYLCITFGINGALKDTILLITPILFVGKC